MTNEFKQLSEIVRDIDVDPGDLIMLRAISNFPYSNKREYFDKAVFHGEVDVYISDGSAGLEKGRHFKGLRIFHHRREDGSFEADNNHTVFYNNEKGLLIPFDYGDIYEYSLIMKNSELPR